MLIPQELQLSQTESGKKSNSLQLLAALAMYRKTNSILIVAKLDRLSRNV